MFSRRRQGRRHGFEGGDNFATPTICLPGGHETEHCTCFIIVIMTCKRLSAANEITVAPPMVGGFGVKSAVLAYCRLCVAIWRMELH